MLDRADIHLTDRVALLVRGIFDKRAIIRPVGRDEDLRASGLSSLDMVNSCSPSKPNSPSKFLSGR